ncbi:MAG: hypothetical protein AAAB35_28555 [Phyllobacterium sp.]|uniref:hypothetical protein n=1 Tax=Phyllobacterium sp. TaxID=1871046 RepID=UPI0030F08115
MKNYLIIVVPICAFIVSAPMPGESSNKPRSIAACSAALQKKGLTAPTPSTVTASFGKGMWMTIQGKANGGTPFTCKTHHNSVISLTINN